MKKVCLSKKNFDKLLSLSLQNCGDNSRSQPSLPISLPSSFINIQQTTTPSSGNSLILEIDTNYGNKIDLSCLKNNIITNIDWGDNSLSQVPIDYTHIYSNSTPSQKYKIIINGNIEKVNIFLGDSTVSPQPIPIITSIIQFPENCKSISLNSLNNLILVPQTLPKTVTDLSGCFINCIKFNQDLSTWDVSNVSNMQGMFAACLKFNQDLSMWNVSNVTNMRQMFVLCYLFNNGDLPGQPGKKLNKWNVGNVQDMGLMFKGCKSFNQDISNWNVKNVDDMYQIFFGAEKFTQNLSKWLPLLDNNLSIGNMSFFFYPHRCFDVNNKEPDCRRYCDAGYTNFVSNNKEFCRSCPDGYYCPKNSSSPLECPKGTIPSKDKKSCCYNNDVLYRLHDFSGLRKYDLPYDPKNIGFKFSCCNGEDDNINNIVNFPFDDPKYPGWSGYKCKK